MKKDTYKDFTVYTKDDRYTFIHINIDDEKMLYKSMFEFFFTEERILQYVENRKSVVFRPNKASYTKLYQHLLFYIDENKTSIKVKDLDEQMEQILEIEGIVSYEEGKKIVRADKIGKIGEYIFSCILSEYFGFTCIIPKIHLVTDYNMSIFGIDELFLAEDMILFGESKVSINLQNGIKLIKESLKEYEKQIKDEYQLVLSNRFYGDKLQGFFEKFNEYTEVCVSFDEFIQAADIKRIGVPIFIAHGESDNIGFILDELSKIPTNDILGLKTHYYIIALPIFDKFKMIAEFTSLIRYRIEEYKEKRNE